MDQPFPNKPVIHRRSRRTQGPPILQDFEKISLSAQPRGHFSTEDYKSNGIQKTSGLYSGEDSHRLPNRELQMAREIHAKELMLQGKLWKVGEKIRQIIQSQSTETPANDLHKGGEETPRWGQAEKGKVQTKHERRQPGRSRDMLGEESRHGNLRQKINEPAQTTENRMRNDPDAQQARWKGAESPHLKDEDERVHVINQQQINGIPNKTDWTKGKDYRETTYRNTSNNKETMPQKGLEKSMHRWAAEKCKSVGVKLSGESTLPLVSISSHHSQQQQADESLISIPDDSLQLPCSFCNRTFRSERLEKHTKICKNLRQHQVYNSFFHRTKGSQIEEFLKTNAGSKTLEFPKKRKI